MGAFAIFEVKVNSILDICYRFFIGRALSVAPLQGRAIGKIAPLVFLDDDFKHQLPHFHCPYSSCYQQVYVVHRTLSTWGQDAVRVKRGASFYFDASIPHSLRNIGKRTAKCLSVITPPVL